MTDVQRLIRAEAAPAYAALFGGKLPRRGRPLVLPAQALPQIAAEIVARGFEANEAQAILGSWLSYDALALARDIEEETGEPVPPRALLRERQLQRLAKELKAFTSYADSYGAAELQWVVRTFGTHHFGI